MAEVKAAEIKTNGIFRPHQQEFINTQVALRNSPGCIIDHEVGSGKTLTVIGVVEALRKYPEVSQN